MLRDRNEIPDDSESLFTSAATSVRDRKKRLRYFTALGTGETVVTHGNGKVTTFAYRDDTNGKDNMLASISTPGVTTLDYSYDANKNKTAEVIDGGTGTMSQWGFSVPGTDYDDDDRLVNWNRDDGNQDQSWNLSLVGDWNTFSEEAVTETRAHNGVHELTSITGGTNAGNSVTTPRVISLPTCLQKSDVARSTSNWF